MKSSIGDAPTIILSGAPPNKKTTAYIPKQTHTEQITYYKKYYKVQSSRYNYFPLPNNNNKKNDHFPSSIFTNGSIFQSLHMDLQNQNRC